MGVRRQGWMPFRPPLLPADEPTSIKHRGQYKYIDFYISLLNLTKPFNSGLKKWMRKATCYSGSVVSSNPRRWRGERLHHHGGGVCWLFTLLWMDLWCHKTIVCKKWHKNNPKEGLCGVTFWPTLACTTPSPYGNSDDDSDGPPPSPKRTDATEMKIDESLHIFINALPHLEPLHFGFKL